MIDLYGSIIAITIIFGLLLIWLNNRLEKLEIATCKEVKGEMK